MRCCVTPQLEYKILTILVLNGLRQPFLETLCKAKSRFGTNGNLKNIIPVLLEVIIVYHSHSLLMPLIVSRG